MCGVAGLDKRDPGPPTPRPAPADGWTVRVVLVENHTDGRRQLTTVLRLAGIDVAAATQPTSADEDRLGKPARQT